MSTANDGRIAIRRQIKADGSCLFNAITLALENCVDKALEVRQVVASIILSDQNKYNRATLQEDPKSYS